MLTDAGFGCPGLQGLELLSRRLLPGPGQEGSSREGAGAWAGGGQGSRAEGGLLETPPRAGDMRAEVSRAWAPGEEAPAGLNSSVL